MPTLNENLIAKFKDFKSVCETVLDAYFLLDKDGLIIDCNIQAQKLTGFSISSMKSQKNLFECFKFSINNVSLTQKDILDDLPNRVDEVICQRNDMEEDYWLDRDFVLTISSFPLKLQDQLIGFICVLRDVTLDSIIQKNYEKKMTQSLTDKLTGLRNRLFLDIHLKNQLRLVKSSRNEDKANCVSIIMSDIDFFKKINDKWGHQAGDYVLKTVSKIFENSVRASDVVCRYGGEEFIMVLSGATAENALSIAEKLRQRVEGNLFEFEGNTIPVTASFGISTIQNEDQSPLEAVKRADKALYTSKETGRNKALIYKKDNPEFDNINKAK